MFSAFICTIIVLAFFNDLSTSLTIHPSDRSLALTPAPLINTSLTIAGTVSADHEIQCRGDQFGSDLIYHSCLDAFATFTDGFDDHNVKVGRRGTENYWYKLPWKWVSGDGRCVFNIVMKGSAPSETTTGKEIARAAWKLLNRCVRDEDNQGGVITGVGQRGTLEIVLRSYDPSNIQCGTVQQHYTEWDKCELLLQTIPADVYPPQKWGPPGTRGVDMVLPYSWQIELYKCRLSIWGAGGDQDLVDDMTYYDMWNAGVMLAGMCARYGYAGKFEHLGKNGRLWALLDDHSRSGVQGVETTTARNRTGAARLHEYSNSVEVKPKGKGIA